MSACTFAPRPPDRVESPFGALDFSLVAMRRGLQTIPGKSWFQLLRLYGRLQPWFDQTWRLNAFEPIG
jgi:hypothetical protein